MSETPATRTATDSKAATACPPVRRNWGETFGVYREPANLRMLALGFSAGLPPTLIIGTLAYWLRKAGVDQATIGYFSWVGLAYAFKWLWAPLVDRLALPVLGRMLGRRRSWLLLAQCTVMGGLLGMALTDPQTHLHQMAWCALAVAFGSATQDIALDAYRIESATAERQAALAATYMTGFRIGMIWAGAGVLWLVALSLTSDAGNYQRQAWTTAYCVMAASMLVGSITVLFAPEHTAQPLAPARNAVQWLNQTLVAPFADFFQRYGWHAALILGLIAIYRISDVVMGIMANPFYVDMGYTEAEVASVSKVFGIVMTLAGAFIGGVISMRIGVMRVLMLGAVLSASSNLLFAWLSTRGHDLLGLIAVVSADNLAGGIASAAFVAYLSSLTNVNYSATQYAMFSSMMLLLPKWLAGFSGVYVSHFGYAQFFVSTALLGMPVLILVWLAARVHAAHTHAASANAP